MADENLVTDKIGPYTGDTVEFTGKIYPTLGVADSVGTTVSGHLDDGTPYFTKLVNATITDTNSSVANAHGIAGNIQTNAKVISVGFIHHESSEEIYNNVGTTGNEVVSINIDDTNVTINRVGTTGAEDYTITINYIK